MDKKSKWTSWFNGKLVMACDDEEYISGRFAILGRNIYLTTSKSN